MERSALTCLKLGVLFLYLHINIGRWDILPDFVGMFLLAASVGNQKQRTEAEIRLVPLFDILGADYFLHWLFDFEMVLEGLIITMVFCYVMFVLFGEIAARIRGFQPYRARLLEYVRAGAVLFSTMSFLASAYGSDWLNGALACLGAAVLIASAYAVWGIRAAENAA